MTLAFLDTETTGLTPGTHQVWEVALALGSGPIVTIGVPHDLTNADPEALKVNGYHRRPRPEPKHGWREQLIHDLTGVTIVGANPGFDMAMLGHLLGTQPWAYRSVDVATAVMWLAGWEEPRGLLGATYEMRNRGHRIPMPNHTAAGDVATVRALHTALRPLLARPRP